MAAWRSDAWRRVYMCAIVRIPYKTEDGGEGFRIAYLLIPSRVDRKRKNSESYSVVQGTSVRVQHKVSTKAQALQKLRAGLTDRPQPFEFADVFHIHETVSKRLDSGIIPLDVLLSGGLVRGRTSEFIGRAGSGRTSLAAAFAAAATYRGEVVGWIDGANAFDPASMIAAGVDLVRVLWVSARDGSVSRSLRENSSTPFTRRQSALLKAAELVLDAGGFGLVVIDFGDLRYPIPQSSALRLARAAERSGAAVIALASRRMCGTFAYLSLAINRVEASFDCAAIGAPAVFDGLELDIKVARNKLGGSDGRTVIRALVDPIEPHSSPSAGSAKVTSSAKIRPTALHGSGN